MLDDLSSGVDTKTEAVGVKAKSWMRYLNPFYFDVGALKLGIYGNLAVCLLYAGIIFFGLVYVRPTALRIANRSPQTIERLQRISDPEKLRQKIVEADQEFRSVYGQLAELLQTFCISLMALLLVISGNAFYLHKAYRLLSSKMKIESSSRRSSDGEKFPPPENSP